MDGHTDIQTDRPSYRDARTHLKRYILGWWLKSQDAGIDDGDDCDGDGNDLVMLWL